MNTAATPTTQARATAAPSAGAGDALARSFTYCKDVARSRARNFYYGIKVMPEPKRSAMHAVYAWMRAADDLADRADTDSAGPSKTTLIERFRQFTRDALDPSSPGTMGAVQDDTEHAPMWPAVRKTFLDYRIPAGPLDDMIAGQLLDQHVTRYDTFAQLYDYCYKVASTVGLVCINVWGYDGSEATRKLAEERGIALQLTNILRDVVEDARGGRA